MTRIVYDFEFVEDGRTIAPVSLGAVAEDGRELYAVFAELPELVVATDTWLSANVWPHLPTTPCPRGHRCLTRGRGHLDTAHPDVRPSPQIARLWSDFVKATPDPELWADHGAYDHVTQAQLFGRMDKRPPHIPMYTNEIQQEIDRQPVPVLPVREPAQWHHALADARHGLALLRHIDTLGAPA